MPIFLTLIVLIAAFSPPALAQDNRIIVIDENGKVSELDIGPSTSVLRKDNPAPAPAAPAPAPTAAPRAAKADPVVMPAKKPAAKTKPAEKIATPAKKPPVKKAAESKKKKTSEPKQTARAKPALPREYVSPKPTRLGPQMTPEDAIRIALDVAPPARTVNAYPVNYKGAHAYEVVFRTEDGDQFVYIDRETGRIVK